MGIEDFTPDEWRKLHELVKEEQEFIKDSKEKVNQTKVKIKQLVFALNKTIDSPEHQEELKKIIDKMKGELQEVSDKIFEDENTLMICDNKISRIIDVIGNG
ncbi:MAG: hypothetical protein E6R13_10120 [Spirochaetes bacterium]|nr:MAG: hypothetical protein E6R13_10120 [Spirochaetota bacterium]